MLIKVTQEHIDEGTPMHCWRCPVALAIRDTIAENETYGRLPSVDVNRSWGSISGIDYDKRWFAFSERVVSFIDTFDRGDHVWPFEFELGTEFSDMVSLGKTLS